MNAQEKYIRNRLAYLLEIQSKTKEEFKGIPEGKLRISCSKGRVQYYLRRNTIEKTDTYLGKDKIELIMQLAKKDYCQRLNKAAEEEIEFLQKILNRYPKHLVEDIYSEMTEKRKELIIPLIDTNETFLEKWISKPYQGKGIADDVPELITNRGERVRSKSELIIANLLDKMQIPYKYECPLVLKQIGVVYPDFTILDLYRRKEIYWEHLGMMDDPDYAERAVQKIRYYNISGYYPGDRLIITSETRDNPINIRQITGLVEHTLLCPV